MEIIFGLLEFMAMVLIIHKITNSDKKTMLYKEIDKLIDNL